MPLESPTFISDLVPANPLPADDIKQGDDHIRNLKTAITNTFPNGSRAFYFPNSADAQTATVNVAVADQNKVFPVDATAGGITVNGPPTTNRPDGFEFTVQKTDSSANAVTIDFAGTETCNGATTFVLTEQYQGVRFIWLEIFAVWLAFPSKPQTFNDIVISETLKLTGVLTPSEITANQDNYAPTGHADVFRFRLTVDADRNITGLAGGAAGRVVCIANVDSAQSVNLIDESASSTAANRFAFGGTDYILAKGRSILLIYDGTSSRWCPLHNGLPANIAVTNIAVTNITQTGYTDVAEISAPSAPAANSLRFYVRDEGGVSEFYVKRSDDSERVVGGAELIETKTTTSGLVVDFDNLVLAPYSSVILLLDGVSPDADSSTPLLLLSDDAGSSFENIAGLAGSASSGDQVFRASDIAATTGFNLTRGSIDNSQTDLFGMIEIFLPGVAATRKIGRAYFGWGPGGSWDFNISIFASVSMGAINKIRLDWIGSVNFDAGTVKLLGRR